jgi:hypothetical protein
MRTNSPIGDSQPFFTEEEQPKPEVDALEAELVQLGANSKKYKEICAYVDSRKEFYRRWLPGGEDLSKLSASDRGNMWLVANNVIAELDAFIDTLEGVKNATKSLS